MKTLLVPALRLVLVAGLPLALLAGCNSLSQEDQVRLDTFKYNSKRFYEEGKLERAEDQCRKGLVLDPADTSLRQILGFSLVQQNTLRSLQESIHVFEQAIDDEDEFDFRNHLGLGTALFTFGRLLEESDRKVQADENIGVDEREDRLATIHEHRDDAFARAETALRDVLDRPRSRDDRTAQSMLAQLYAVQGRYVEASDVLRRLVSQQATSLRLRADQMNVQSLPPERKALFEREIAALRTQQNSALTLLATVAAKLKRWEEVVSVYAQVEAADAMTPADYANRARAYDAMGASEAAAADYENFIRKASVMAQYNQYGDEIGHAMQRIQELRRGASAKTRP